MTTSDASWRGLVNAFLATFVITFLVPLPVYGLLSAIGPNPPRARPG